MTLKRCPSCRTLCDPAKDQRCFACEGDLSAAPAAPPTAKPQVLREVRRDQTSSSAALSVFALIGGIGVFGGMTLHGVPREFKFGLGAVLVAGLLLGLWSETRRSAPGSLGRIVLKGFAAFGMVVAVACFAVFGLLVLLFAACSLRILR